MLFFIVAWYLLSTVNNIVEKAVLNAADAPLGLGLSQMFGTALISYVCISFSGKPVIKQKHRSSPWEADPEAMVTVEPSAMRVNSYAAVMRIVPIAGCVAGMRGLHNVALGSCVDPVSALNALGICLAMGGLAYYNYTKHTNGAVLKVLKDKSEQSLLPSTLAATPP